MEKYYPVVVSYYIGKVFTLKEKRLSFKNNFKRWVPVQMKELYHRFTDTAESIETPWVGNYSTFYEAEADCEGYQTDIIFNKVLGAALKVRDGKAAYERDSVVFETIQYNWPLLSCLLHSALQKETPTLQVLDFGGAFGTTYFAVKKFLPREMVIRWIIVEQPHFVKKGMQEFENEEINFAYDIASAFKGSDIDIVLLSGSLQYLQNPQLFLDDLLKYSFRYLMFDRTFFINQDDDRIVVQKVPDDIYNASYPCHLFNEEKFLQHLAMLNCKLIADFESEYDLDSLTKDNKTVYSKGFYLKHDG
jgi:putative methyltransferase (TIGR04325 family)